MLEQRHQRIFMEISTIVLLAIAILGIVAVMLTLRAQRQRPKKKVVSGVKKHHSSAKRAPLSKNKYRAVSIKSDQNSCAAVRAIGTKRFLVEDKETPQLPLPDCDAAECACTYVHHQDRRNPDVDRRALVGSLQTKLYEHADNDERRAKRGRRPSDWE
jgi:hypothetical protein